MQSEIFVSTWKFNRYHKGPKWKATFKVCSFEKEVSHVGMLLFITPRIELIAQTAKQSNVSLASRFLIIWVLIVKHSHKIKKQSIFLVSSYIFFQGNAATATSQSKALTKIYLKR